MAKANQGPREGNPARERKNVRTAWPTSRRRSTTRSSPSPTRPAASAGARPGRIGFKGSRKGTPFAAQLAASNAANSGPEHGVRYVDVRSRARRRPRVGDPRPPGERSRDQVHQGRDPDPPQRLPAAQAAARLSKDLEEDSSGTVHRGEDQSAGSRREGMKLFLKGERCFKEKCASRAALYPPGQHGSGATRCSPTACSCARSRRSSGLRRARASSATTSPRRSASKGVTGENLLVPARAAARQRRLQPGFASSRAQARQLVRHGHVAVNGSKVTSPRSR
jgi:hypothetical protein